jgi:hypothetical protein
MWDAGTFSRLHSFDYSADWSATVIEGKRRRPLRTQFTGLFGRGSIFRWKDGTVANIHDFTAATACSPTPA